MPFSRRRLPNIILSDTGGRSATHKRMAKTRRFTKVSGRRGGFPHPLPSRVPTGSLETKSQKFAQITYDLLAGGVSTHVNTINQGTANADRLGYKIRNTAVHIKGNFSCVATGPRQAIDGYFLVWDRSPNTSLAAPSDIFNVNAGAGYDLGNTFPVDNDRFVVLKSMRRKMSFFPNNGLNMHLVDDYVSLPKYCVTGFTKGNASGLIANTQTGALLLIPYRSVTEANTGGDDKVEAKLVMELFFAEA